MIKPSASIPAALQLLGVLAGCSALTANPACAAPSAPSALNAVPRYGKLEASFTLPGQTGNPFDPQANDVDAFIDGPSGLRQEVPAFWDGDRWRVRYAPSRLGLYSMRVERNGQLERPADLTASRFRCIASANPGFVRRSKTQLQAFAFDSGRPYYPLGIDVAWMNGKAFSYSQYFTHMRQDGMNLARVWMNNWDGKNLEWSADTAHDQTTHVYVNHSPAIGSYSLRTARYWDSIFDEAARNNVYIQLTLQHHGQYTAYTDHNWQDNPFNAANGGFLKNPEDFFTDARAKALTKAKYRYIVARYGYSTHLMAFELFNEVQNITEESSHFQDVVAWHTEMANYIRSIDPYHHLITTSFTPNDSPLYKTPIDYAQLHIYAPDVVSSVKAVNVPSYTKPVFVGEWGQQGGAPQDHNTVEQVVFTSIATPMAGAATFWFWDQMDNLNAWPIYASASGFLKADHVASFGPTKALDADVESSGARADLSFSPPLGWAPSTTLDAQISSSGVVHGTEGMSSFLQGTGHTDMQPRPFTFHLDAAKPTEIAVKFGQVGAGGAHPILAVPVQGIAAAQSDFPKSDKNHDANLTLTVTVPAGEQEFTLGNAGPDWITIDSITVKHYAPSLAVTTRGNGREAVFYARSRVASGNATATVSLADWAPGRYEVRLWNPQQGAASGDLRAHVGSDRRLTFRLQDVADDAAGVVVPAAETAK